MKLIIGEGRRICHKDVNGKRNLRDNDLASPADIFSEPPRVSLSLILFLKGDGEGGLAGFSRIVECRALAVALRGAEKESLLDFVGKSGEAGLACRVGSHFEVQLVKTSEAVGDVDLDPGVIDWRTGCVGDGEVGGAGADCSVDDGNGIRVLRGILGQGWRRKHGEGEGGR
jgi:hypothetical protein